MPNAEQDAYSYLETIERMAGRLSAGNFGVSDLMDFWPTLYPFSAALLTLFLGNALVAGKIIAALCGAASCVLVFAIVRQLTHRAALAWLGFALILCNPLHLFYSSASMTDIPHACFILASLCAALRRNWMTAALCMAVAQGMRVEAWIFALLLPLLQFVYERRISLRVILILIAAPLLWIAISYLATGNPLSFFAERSRYVASYLEFEQNRRGFLGADVWRDLAYFMLGANAAVQLMAGLAGCALVFLAVQRREPPPSAPAITACYFFALLAFLGSAYLAKSQPVIWVRYGLIFFALGLPLAIWIGQELVRFGKPGWLVKTLATVALLLSITESARQIPVIFHALEGHQAQKTIAGQLSFALRHPQDQGAKCFCDDPAVRVLSGLGPGRFVRSTMVPPGAAADVTVFEDYLRRERVLYLVFAAAENSLPGKIYPTLLQSGPNLPRFEHLGTQRSGFGPDLSLYRLRLDKR